ncbi:MAG TPA: NADH-quinone oxidoreductase subunit C [Candidatus Acidoferrales bacterium]|nr:NADH-quinone oxidoreductase subunit C [Candidatus Acidoferrales bacterium]
MSALETIPAELGIEEAWAQQGGTNWIASQAIDVRKLAELMKARKARFISITTIQIPDEEDIVMDYHWDLDGELLTFEVPVQDKKMPSIIDLCEAADWIEREIHEHYAIEFSGRDYEPLLLRAGDTPGVNLREED